MAYCDHCNRYLYGREVHAPDRCPDYRLFRPLKSFRRPAPTFPPLAVPRNYGQGPPAPPKGAPLRYFRNPNPLRHYRNPNRTSAATPPGKPPRPPREPKPPAKPPRPTSGDLLGTISAFLDAGRTRLSSRRSMAELEWWMRRNCDVCHRPLRGTRVTVDRGAMLAWHSTCPEPEVA